MEKNTKFTQPFQKKTSTILEFPLFWIFIKYKSSVDGKLSTIMEFSTIMDSTIMEFDSTMIFGKEYTGKISNPLARQNVAAV